MRRRIEELEREAAQHRANLAEAMNGLRESAKLPSLTGPEGILTSDEGAGVAASALETAKRYPWAAALIGAGLAYKLMPSGKDDDDEEIPGGISAEYLRLSLYDGLDHLDPQARRRVVAKRLDAIALQEEIEASRPQKSSARKLAGFPKHHPLVSAVAVAGLSAALSYFMSEQAGESDPEAQEDAPTPADEANVAAASEPENTFHQEPAPQHPSYPERI
ncbi:hypothetical protein [Sagittula stellata]|uniref:DUF3618 domain-containing protein n=1 Tax=Sagittula stellata (strain ATCC 700073 / DSM 11524 / E-37) TaxID=388399 RepID=A3K2K7_SAGS3|nr:hypothetical protein [Sagittula stellata]EBA08416.1 hypothetical protein SSE37_16428 [Sagittula stellata E-37]